MAENDADAPPPAPLEDALQVAEPAPEGAPPSPGKKRRRGGHGFTLFLAALGLSATALGGAAVVFKKQDERLGVIADAIERAAQNPAKFVLKEKEELGAWLAEKLPRGEEERKTIAAPPAGAVASSSTAHVDSAPSAPAPAWAAPRDAEQKPPTLEAQAEPTPQAAAPSAPPPSAVESAELAALAKRLQLLEAEVRAANEAAAEARRAAEAKPQPERTEPAGTGPETKTLIAPLEARLDELAQSMAKLQEQLEQPKVGTRAPPDVDSGAARPPQAKAITALESLALAQEAQRALERAKPFGAELSALSRLGADPKAVAELAPFAQKGAPTPRDLLNAFEPIGRRLRAFEDKPPEGTPLTEHLMREAQRLVHLRPKGEATKATADELTPKIEKALAHDDLAGALQAFAALPEATRAQAKEFGEALAARRAAEEAAASLVANAIGDLDAGKN